MGLRLLCCYLFHLSNYGDVTDGYTRLKFLKNHPRKFESQYLFTAFLVTQYQFWASLLCELVNIVFITRQGTLIDIIMNYVAFEGISAMDNLYTETLRNMEVQKAIPEGDAELEKYYQYKKESTREPAHQTSWTNLKVKEHEWLMKFLIVWQQLLRVLFKGVYFYMVPYFIVPFSFWVYQHDDM